MATNIQILLLAVVFASQLIVLSFYVPLRWRRYYALMFRRYPPDQYPRLYPVSTEEIEKNSRLFRLSHLAAAASAAVGFIGALVFARSPRLMATVMSVCLLVQLILMMSIAMRLEARIRMAFRVMSPPRVRSAELRRWGITDFVSPLWIGFGLALQIMGLACAAVVWLHWPRTLALIPTSVAGGAVLLRMIYELQRQDRFTRADPYMSAPDTFLARQARYRRVFGAGAFLGAYQIVILLYNAQLIRFDGVYLFMFFSIVGQLIGLILVTGWTRDLGKRDLSVYRADSAAEVAS